MEVKEKAEALLLQKEGLEQLSIAKDNFVASLSHEMRTASMVKVPP